MNNNDILRRLRFAFDYNDNKMARIISLVEEGINSAQIERWQKREDHADFQPMSDKDLCKFLDGLIIEKRGPRPDGTKPAPLEKLSRNEILKKLRIALELREEGMMAVFKNVGFIVTKAELGSFFRKENQRNYSDCPEQVLRKFIQGLGKATK